MSASPARLLFIRPDTYGDFVLFEPVLRLVKEALPATAIGILIREPYADITPLLGGGDFSWLTTACDPYRNAPNNDLDALLVLRDRVLNFAPDCLVAACFERTWLEAAVASFLPDVRQIALGTREFDPFVRSALESQMSADWTSLYPERVKVEAEMLEWEKNLRLADALKRSLTEKAVRSGKATAPSLAQIAKNLDLEAEELRVADAEKHTKRGRAQNGRDAPRWWPKIALPQSALKQARELFATLGVEGSALAVCCPAGTANVKIKSWPSESFGEIVAWLERERGIRALLLGHETERKTLETVQRSAQAHGATPFVWFGRNGEIALAAAILAETRFYLGNDTGTLHLAAALERPAVSIFGGGHWPRFKPLARRSAVVVQPLPCFGCDWNCLFGYAPCVREIPVSEVRSAVEWLLARDANEESEHIVRDAIPESGLKLITGAVAALGRGSPEGSGQNGSASPAKVTELLQKLEFSEKDRAARLQAIERQGDEIVRLEAEVARWLKEANQLWPQLNDAKNARERIAADAEHLRAQLATSEADRDARFRVIEEQSGQITRLESETDRWLREARDLWPRVNAAENARELLACEVEVLRGHFAASEADRAARLRVIEEQGGEISAMRQELDEFRLALEQVREERAFVENHWVAKLLKRVRLWPKRK